MLNKVKAACIVLQRAHAVVTSISWRGFLALYSSSALNSGVRSVNTLPTSVSTMSEFRCG